MLLTEPGTGYAFLFGSVFVTFLFSFILLLKKNQQQPGTVALIPALWEAEAGGSRGQEIETILVNMVKPRLY